MTIYTHFEHSYPCASGGYFVGPKGSETQLSDGSGYLYQAGTRVTATAAVLNTLTGSDYSRAVNHTTTANLRIAAGEGSASAASLDVPTGLTSITYAVVASMYRQASVSGGEASTSFTPKTQEMQSVAGLGTIAAWRNAGSGTLRVQLWRHVATRDTLEEANLGTGFSWIAIGT